jgi:hypothetical protein
MKVGVVVLPFAELDVTFSGERPELLVFLFTPRLHQLLHQHATPACEYTFLLLVQFTFT